MKSLLFSLVVSACAFAQQAQGPLTNSGVGGLVLAGVPTSEVIHVIATAPRIDFDLRPVSTDALLKIGVSEEIIKSMAEREGQGALNSSPKLQAAASKKLLTADATTRAYTGKLRVFVEHSNDSWSYTASKNAAEGSTHPQTVEMMKTFGQSCPNLIVTNDREKADYIVTFERESHKLIRRDSKLAAFSRSGDMVYSASTRELGNAVRGFCASIQ